MQPRSRPRGGMPRVSAELWFTTDPPCSKCGRPIATQGDLDRWFNGVAAGWWGFMVKGRTLREPHSGDPQWSTRLCWAMRLENDPDRIGCHLKPVDPFTATR